MKKRGLVAVAILGVAIGLLLLGREFAAVVPGFVEWGHGLGW